MHTLCSFDEPSLTQPMTNANADSGEISIAHRCPTEIVDNALEPPPVFDIYRYDTGIWGFIDSFRVVLVNGMRKWYASY
jgi:hypothetical protein